MFLTSESLHVVNPLVLHGVKVLVCCFISRILQQDPSSGSHLNINKHVTLSLFYDRLCQLHVSSVYAIMQIRNTKTNIGTCGVSSLACFTAACMPSTVLLLADPTAAAFSAVAPSRPAWASKFPARSSKTYNKH